PRRSQWPPIHPASDTSGRNINSGASDRPLHGDPIFGRNAQIPVIRRGLAEPVKSTQDGSFFANLDRQLSGRVEVWRGDVRLSMSVSAPFVWRCLSGSAVAPFPHPAHRTGRADFPHPALGQDFTPSFACDAIGSF